MQKKNRYYGIKASEYDKRRFEGHIGSQVYNYEKEIFLNLISQINKYINNDVLDLATGTGRFMEILLKFDKAFYLTGIDISDEMLEIAKDKLNNYSSRYKLIQMDINMAEKLMNIGKYGLIIGMRIFTLFPKGDVERILHNITKNMSKDSYLLIDVGNKGLFRKDKINRFSIGEISILLASAGFYVENINGLYFIPTQLLRLTPNYITKFIFSVDLFLSKIFPNFTSRLFILARKIS